MGGGARSTSAKPAPSATPAPASVPADGFATRPIVQAPRQAAPAPRPASDPSETAAFLAAAAQRPTASSTIRYAAPQQPVYTAPEPELEPPVMDLDDLSNRQFAFDSWAASDLDETSGGMPALDIPVNPLFAAAENVAPHTTTPQHTPTVRANSLAPAASKPRITAKRRAAILATRLPPRPLPITTKRA